MPPSSRRLPAWSLLVLIAALLVSVLPLSPASADAGNGIPGTHRVDAGSIATAYYASCAVVDTGAVRCWGATPDGELAQGNGDPVGDDPDETTVAIDLGGRRATQVSGAGYSFCALLDTGQVRCWGGGGYGQLAQGDTDAIGDDPGEIPVAVDLGTGRTAVAISVGDSTACAILDNGALNCWGHGNDGLLAQGDTDDIGDDPGETTVPIDLGPGRTAVAVSMSQNTACAILDDGALKCWGAGGYGQLLQGNSDDIGDDPGEVPVRVDLGPGRTAVAVAVSDYTVCAILDTGALDCWGDSRFFGQLAQGNTDRVGTMPGDTPVSVDLGAGRTAVAISSDYYSNCAVLDNGQVRCWGYNDYGQLGQGNTVQIGDDPGETTVGLDLGPGRTAIAVSAGYTTVCLTLDDRSIRCLGDDSSAQLDQGSITPYGANPGETPAGAGSVRLEGLRYGNDTDGDGVRDAVDSCPTNPGITVGSCLPAAPPVLPVPTSGTPTTTAAKEAVLHGRSVILHVRVVTKSPATGCSGRVKVHIKTRTKRGPLHKVKRLGVATVGSTCTATGKVTLRAEPRHSAKVKVVVAGRQIRKRTLHAVRVP